MTLNILHLTGSILLAEWLSVCIIFIALGAAVRMLPKSGMVTRWTAAMVTAILILTSLFHLFSLCHQFNTLSSFFSLTLLLLLTHVCITPARTVLMIIRADLLHFLRQLRIYTQNKYRYLHYLIGLLMTVTILRTCQVPPLAWDTLVYHGVKSAMWVQNQGQITMQAPGSWFNQIVYHGGSEIINAWTMLPFHSDLLTGLLDSVFWLAIGWIAYGLCREMRINRTYRLIVTGYILFIPALKRSIGTNYVEPCLMLLLLSGLFFLFRFIRKRDNISLLLTITAMSLAVGVKITVLTLYCITWLIVLIVILISKHGKRRLFILLIPAFLVSLVIIGPWLIRNMQYTGYPLGHMPVQLPGLILGKLSPNLEWFYDRANFPANSFRAEIESLRLIFNSPLSAHTHLSLLSAIPFLMGIAAILHRMKREPLIAFTMLFWTIAVLGYYYHPGFSVIRIGWAAENGRFLLPLMIPMAMYGFSFLRDSEKWAWLFIPVITSGILLHGTAGIFTDWSRPEWLAVFSMILVLVCLFIFYKFILYNRHRAFLWIVTGLLPLMLLPPLDYYRNHLRYVLASQSTINHPYYRYWIPSAKHTDHIGHSYKIAVTSGPRQNGMTWFTYFFLGINFQNRLCYIPVTENERIVDFSRDHIREKQACYSCWKKRIFAEDVDYVMSFIPSSIELNWMKTHPEKFRRIDGGFMNRDAWGLYQVIR